MEGMAGGASGTWLHSMCSSISKPFSGGCGCRVGGVGGVGCGLGGCGCG